jgi:hypothetical protein
MPLEHLERKSKPVHMRRTRWRRQYVAHLNQTFQESETFMKDLYGVSLLFLGLCLSALAGAQTGIPAGAAGALNSTWTDPDTGLMWTRTDNGSDLDWNEATTYCSKLQLAGYSGWRLPTLEELQGISDPSVRVQTTYDFGVVAVFVKGKLKLTGWDWSSTQGDKPEWAQTFGYSGENRGAFPLRFNYNMRALCVRRFE